MRCAISAHPKHLVAGPGVIESGFDRHYFWTVKGANSILALRCCHQRRFEDYREGRRLA